MASLDPVHLARRYLDNEAMVDGEGEESTRDGEESTSDGEEVGPDKGRDPHYAVTTFAEFAEFGELLLEFASVGDVDTFLEAS